MAMSAPKKIFGTDGVRGRANVEPVTAETALKLGRAAGHVFKTLEFIEVEQHVNDHEHRGNQRGQQERRLKEHPEEVSVVARHSQRPRICRNSTKTQTASITSGASR